MEISDKWCLSVLAQMLFSIFINNIDSGIEFTLRKSVNDTKLHSVVNKHEGLGAIQRDLDRLEKLAQENLITFNKSQCNILHLSHGNPHYECKLGDKRIEHSPAKKDLGVLVDGNWT